MKVLITSHRTEHHQHPSATTAEHHSPYRRASPYRQLPLGRWGPFLRLNNNRAHPTTQPHGHLCTPDELRQEKKKKGEHYQVLNQMTKDIHNVDLMVLILILPEVSVFHNCAMAPQLHT